jgi:hypothetical protein
MPNPTPLTPRRVALTLATAAALAAPATVALAADENGLDYIHFAVPAGRIVEDGLEDHARKTLTDRAVRLGRRAAKLRGGEFRARGYRARIDDWSITRLQRRIGRLRAHIGELERTGGAPDVAIPGALAGIAACESGGDPGAIGGGGLYRGKYQFDMGTWASVGGSGDPAAAPEAEQDRRAAMLYARSGATPWPVCGR